MIPWKLLDTIPAKGSDGELTLYKHESEFSIRINGHELMNSNGHFSEEMLAEVACKRIADRPKARILIGGLGMGFTAAAALKFLSPKAIVVVAEYFSAVIQWNKKELAQLTGNALADSRIVMCENDVASIMRDSPPQSYDALLLDVDNGPNGLTRKENNWLYTDAGLTAAKRILRPRGVFALWSAGSDKQFGKTLFKAGFLVEEILAKERDGKGKKKHTIWLGINKSA